MLISPTVHSLVHFEGLVKVPYVNLSAQHGPIKAELLDAVKQIFEHGQFVLGTEVEQFENQFANLCGTRFAVGTNSGTDALILALRALQIGDGDEVVTVPNSFVSTTSSIMLVGARPVFVDVQGDYNMDPAQLERAITSKTRAILLVHMTGRPASMNEIIHVAEQHGVPIIEDCAQAVSAEYDGQRVGGIGTIGCFSLHPLKTLNACGDGGVITTNNERLHERVRLLGNLGLRNRNDCVEWAGNSRLDTLQAAILLVKLRHLESWTERRRANGAYYQKALREVVGVQVPEDSPHERAVYHTFMIQSDRRDELKAHLELRGVGTAIHYPTPIHLQSVAATLGYRRGSFPVAERQASQILSLPVYPELTEADLESVVMGIREFYHASM